MEILTNEESITTLQLFREINSKIQPQIVFDAIENAIKALESIDRITAERDAAINDLSYTVLRMGGACWSCKRNKTCLKEDKPCKWEWRGVER